VAVSKRRVEEVGGKWRRTVRRGRIPHNYVYTTTAIHNNNNNNKQICIVP